MIKIKTVRRRWIVLLAAYLIAASSSAAIFYLLDFDVMMGLVASIIIGGLVGTVYGILFPCFRVEIDP